MTLQSKFFFNDNTNSIDNSLKWSDFDQYERIFHQFDPSESYFEKNSQQSDQDQASIIHDNLAEYESISQPQTPEPTTKILPTPTRENQLYDKNICRNIAKIALKSLLSPDFADKVTQLCDQELVAYPQIIQTTITIYKNLNGKRTFQQIFSNTHRGYPQSHIRVLYRFMVFYLSERYMRYLMLEGRMHKRKEYVRYKNQVMIGLLERVGRVRGRARGRG